MRKMGFAESVAALIWRCAGFDSYRTLIRPSFKVAYKLVTALEWRCCPGFAGEECRKGELCLMR